MSGAFSVALLLLLALLTGCGGGDDDSDSGYRVCVDPAAPAVMARSCIGAGCCWPLVELGGKTK